MKNGGITFSIRLNLDQIIYDASFEKEVMNKIYKCDEMCIGYFELIFNFEKKDCEVAYFGIFEEFFGKKYGGYLLSGAIKNSFKKDIEKVWLHTCSLDHENALNNYLARGMKIFKSQTIALNI